jgi:hypothetical protein
MLIKVLSFIASVLGTARYKAVFLPCLAVVLSFTGITLAAVVHNAQVQPVSNKIAKSDSSAPSTTTNTAPRLGGIHSQTPKSESQPTGNQPNSANSTTTPNSTSPNTAGNTPTPTTTTDILTSSNKVTLSNDNNTADLTVRTTDNSAVTWSVLTDNATGIQARLRADQSATGGSTVFQLQADGTTAPGTYQLTVFARDASRNLTLSKSITVIVQ